MKKFLLLVAMIGSCFSLSAQYCIPTLSQAASSCSGANMKIQAFSVNGGSGSISDAMICNGTGYLDRTSQSVTFYKGGTYTTSLTSGPTNAVYAQVWIDFNGDLTFASGETVGGISTSFVNTTSFPINIPLGAPSGTFRMRVIVSWTGNGANYPSINPCMSGYSYGEARDYTVTITNPPPNVATSVTSLSFSATEVATPSAAQVFSITGTYMTSTPVTVSSSSAAFEFSFNGSTWFSTPQTYGFSLPGFTSIPLYVRFTPASASFFDGLISISGGGLATAKTVFVSGTGASPCAGTPDPGTASMLPMAGGGSTPFTLSLSGYSASSGLTFQWQSSPTGTGSWSNLSGATNDTYNFTGIGATTYYRCNVTCSNSTITEPSNVVSASLFPASSCTPAFSASSCPGNAMNASFASLIGVGSSITDPSSSCTGHYVNNTGTMSVVLLKGATYTPVINLSSPANNYGTNMSVQMWIDFNSDGAFSAGETVGGTALVGSSVVAGVLNSLPFTIPGSAPTGTYRMRIEGNYQSTTYTTYPTMNPCPTAATTYGQVRDYTVSIIDPPPCTTPLSQPSGLSLSPSLFTISGVFSAAPTPTENYLVVMTTSSVAPTSPSDGVSYTAGTDALGGKIVATGPTTSYTVSGLTDNTPYWFWIYSYNSSCTGGGPMYKASGALSGSVTTAACALSGVKTVGPTGNYTTLAAAIADINSLGVATGGIALELQPTYTGETFPITINTLMCASADKRVTIRPQSTAVTITANTSTQMFSLNGTRYLTIDGRVGSTGTASLLSIINNYTSSSSTSCAIQFINDASYNEVKYTTLRGGSTSTGAGVVLFGTTTGTTGCDSNLIANCEIRESAGFPVNCIYSSGTTGKENSGNTISNCNISNFYHSSSSSYGIFLSTGNSDWTIAGNRLFQTAARSYGSGITHRAIYVNNSSTGNNFSIVNNIIGYSSSAGTGTYSMSSTAALSFYGISFSGASVTPSSIQGNIITNFSFSTSSGMFRGIDIVAGSVDIGTTSGNTIGAATGTGAIATTITSNGSIAFGGIYSSAASPAVLNITGNTIGSLSLNGSSTAIGAGVYGIFAGSTASTTISGNTVGSSTTANSIHSATGTTSTGSQSIYGIYASISNATPVAAVISGNTVANITGNGTGTSNQMYGIYYPNSASCTIAGNNIFNLSTRSRYTTLSTAAGLVGIAHVGSTGTADISGNNIYTLANLDNSTAQSNVVGILFSNAVNSTIGGNKIYDLRNAGTTTSNTAPASAYGIFTNNPGTSLTIVNNMISLGNAQTTNTSFVGIGHGGTTSSAVHKVYFNTVLIEGTAGTSTIHTAALHRGNFNGSPYNTPFDIDNNILMNTRTGGGTGRHYAIANNINGSSSATGWGANASNYNILNTANAATVGYWSGDRTFVNWKSASSSDNNSFTASAVTFTNSAAGDLHINMGVTANNMESHGIVISGYSTDYDNDARPGPAGSTNGGGFGVDIGADEFDGVPIDNIPPVINYTNGTCGTAGNYTFTATVADPAGVPTVGALVPRVYYRKGAGTWFSSAGTLTSGSGTNGTWTFTISASDMGGLVSGNVVSYYVIAQDNSAFVGSNPSPGLVAANVNSVTTPPSPPSTFTVGLSGSYDVGSGGDFNTITLAAAAYNNYCLTGPVVYNLITPTYPSESFPITFNGIATANATNTLTIRPASGNAATINGAASSGAIFKLLNARHITIDGVNAGGSSLTLNSTFTSTYANIWLASTSGSGPGCNNITLKNMTITGGNNATSVTYGILGGMDNGSSPTTSGGFNNDTITIQNNTITKCYYGIYSGGTSASSTGGGDNWLISGNTFGPSSTSTTDNIGMRGIQFTNMLNPMVINNTFQNIGTSSITSQATAIYLSSSVNGGSISGNTIRAISNANSSSSTSANAGIYVGSTCINLNITDNTIRDITTTSTSGGVRGITVNPSNAVANILIANNMISDIRCYATTSITQCPVGIAIDNTAGFVKVYYNTVHLNSSYPGNSTATGSACYYQSSSSAGTDLRNNIFVNTYDNTNSGSDKGWAFYTTVSNSAFAEIDFNNYYAASPNLVGYTSGDRPTLASLQSAYGRNTNSINMLPIFVSGTDLHLQSVAGNNPLAAGTPVSVITDYDGATRNATTPVIGAHEAALGCGSITAGTVSPATAAFCGSGATTITATGATPDQMMQWKSSEDSTSWTTIDGATNATYVMPSAVTVTTFYRLVNTCSSSSISDSATTKVTINPLPTVRTVTGGGYYCTGAGGVAVGLNGSDVGINYQLYADGVSVGSPLAGTGSAISFGSQTLAGTYTVQATNAVTSCVSDMSGDATVVMLVLPTVKTVTGGGDYCAGGSGVAIGLASSDNGVVYQLYNGGTAMGSLVSGTGAAISFGSQTASGTYTVAANPGTTCETAMTGSAVVTILPTPNVYTVSGGGTYCEGGAGFHIVQDFSIVGINYQLYRGATAVGAPIGGASSGLDFGVHTLSGTYTVLATNISNSCTSPMAGSATIIMNTLPAVQTVTGGGTYCSGGSGFSVGLNGSVSGINYQLYNGSSTVGSPFAGTGSAFSFGTFTAAGTYSVLATNATTSCTNNMSGTATIVVNPLPTVYSVTGGGNFCAGGSGVHIGTSHSDLGINYQLYQGPTTIGSALAGASSGLDFGFIATAGVYTVRATNPSTGCINSMSGSATVVVNAVPVVQTVTGGGTICAGASGLGISLNGSETGINYQLYNGSATSGSTVSGTGAALTMTTTTVAGTYTVRATNATTSCVSGMTGSATISVNPAPTAFTMTGGGAYCSGGSGQSIGLSNSTTGINYQLYNGASPVGGTVSGSTGNPISFGVHTASGTYTVLATNTSTTCTGAMSGNAVITINALPTAYTVTGGGSYCSGGTGVNVGLSNSATGISYQLYVGSSTDGSPVTGTGSSLDFGLKTAAGTYTVAATNISTTCTNNMTGTVSVSINAVPAVHNVTGGGNYCSGGAGVAIGLDGSVSGTNYQLYRGSTSIGAPVSGTGSAITFGLHPTSGTYTVVATGANSCTSNMSGSATVTILSVPSAFSVTGGGDYCEGGAGVPVGLASSTTGINYQLYRGPATVGAPLAGTGSPLAFGNQTVAGTYTVLATDAVNSCTTIMTGSAAVMINPLPTAFNVSGGGSFCTGQPGVHVGMSFMTSGVNYQLYRGSSTVGSPVAGTNSSYDFGLFTTAGTYTVFATNATTGCVNNMSGSAVVIENPLPVAYSVTGGGNYCSGGTGVAVGLSSSETGINYQLYNGSATTGGPVAGSGSAISFGSQTASGTYTVFATNTTTSCTNNMTGNAIVVIDPLPIVYNVTGGGTLCAGDAGHHIGLDNSETGINYQLYNGSSTSGSPVAGTGSALDFGVFTVAGTYSVHAVNTVTACESGMTGTATVIVNPLPAVQTVTGGGSFCNGGSGVAVGLAGSVTGINYQLYRGTAMVGSALAGTGSAISYGLQTVAGTYSVLATNATTGCMMNMSGMPAVIVNPLPTVYTMTGGGSYCAGTGGVSVGLSGSNSGINYQLYLGASTYGTVIPGTGTALDYGMLDVEGNYTIRATNSSTGCVNNMSGIATVSVNALPAQYAVSGGGSYCSGTGGLTVNLSGSQTGINYQMYNGSATYGSLLSGTGSALSFNSVTPDGSYTVRATNPATGCIRAMTGSATITTLPLPPLHTVTGGGAYCAGGIGVNIGMSGSNTLISYQLYNGATPVGAPFAGTGMTFDFGLQTAVGTYTVFATNIISGCTQHMTGSTTIATNPLPNVQTVTGGGAYCSGGAGVSIGIAGSEPGISYRLYRGTATVGSAVSGTGSALSFGLQTTDGVYTVMATNSTTGCNIAMSGSATITINPLPLVFTVNGGGNYCSGGAGVGVGLSGSSTGINYQLYVGTTAAGLPVAGTGSSITFGMQTVAGTYTVRATNIATGCVSNMTGSTAVVINPLPLAYNVTGGGGYCSGGTGVEIGLSGSQAGTNYTLYNGSVLVGGAAGTGTAITFGNHTMATNYTVQATNATTGCTNGMSGAATVVVNVLPNSQIVSGGGSYCVGSPGVHIGLMGSESGVNYSIYRGASLVGSAAGSGSGIDFGVMTAAGMYSVSGTNTVTGCRNDMSGLAAVIVNSLPSVYTMTGGGSYCSGGSGVALGLDGSQIGVNYRLYNGTATSGLAVAGTGGALSFGMRTVAGTYTVLATNPTTSCSMNMTGSKSVIVNSLPAVFAVSGGGTLCEGGAGYAILLNGSAPGTSYQLYNGSMAVGSPVAGTGSTLTFGVNTVAGTYSVLATNNITSCSRAMSGSAAINVNPRPSTYTVTGGGAYCAGGPGANISLSGSEAGINYQLFNGTTAGVVVSGTGGLLDFGLTTNAGIYTVVATNPLTGCTGNMAGSALITVNPLPVAHLITGGGSFCAGSNGVFVNISSSQPGVSYQLYNGSAMAGSAIAGTGSAFTFGMQTVAGTYSILATQVATSCTVAMTGAVIVAVNPVPATQSVTGGGNYCSGGSGVAVGLAGSVPGISYQLYNGSAPSGTALNGTGSVVNFGLITNPGVYTVLATNGATGCTSAMAGAASVGINPLPLAYYVTGGGNYCAGSDGVHVGLSGSNVGINYQLYNGTSVAGVAVAGTGDELDFGEFTSAGTYSVRATDAATTCASHMTDAVEVSVNPLPAVYAVTGGGSYCAGGSGVAIGLAGSDAGVNYQLFNGTVASGSVVSGTGGALDFGLRMGAGTYFVVATNAVTPCMANMSGSTVVNINALPAVHAISGGGDFCEGSNSAPIILDGSDAGISYRLYNGADATGSMVMGTGSALSFGTVSVGGNYSILATSTATSCTQVMDGTLSVVVNPLPVAHSVTGGGNYCAGGAGIAVGLNSSTIGVSYQLYNGTTPVGPIVNGTSNILNFGLQSAGNYTVIAEDALTHCTNTMTGSSVIAMQANPVVYSVTGGGAYCAGGTGFNIGIDGSQTGITYRLYNGTSLVGAPLTGTGIALDFGVKTVSGTYSVVATDATFGCVSNMSGAAVIVINPLPVVQTVTGGGSYCAGGTGVAINLAASETGMHYELFIGSDATGTIVEGTGTGITFGAHTAPGMYTVLASTHAGCNATMAGSATVAVNPVPAVHNVVASATGYCAGGSGINISLTGSNTGVSYQLYNGAATAGSAIAGTGSSINFGLKTVPGVYTVMANITSTGCSSAMSGSAPITINPLPATFTIAGGGALCAGGAGLPVLLLGSEAGVNYMLYKGTVAVGGSVEGNGSAISFPAQNTAGTYYVRAVNATTGCMRSMSGSTSISINPLPVAYDVTGGGSYCNGGAGLNVGLAGSSTGISYQLYKNTVPAGGAIAGTGAALNFGIQTTGVYTVRAFNALTGCTNNMGGSVTIAVNELPGEFAVTGGGSFCDGGSGVAVGLSGSATGINYRLYKGATMIGTQVSGTGGAIGFGMHTVAGTYTVVAINAATGCTKNMTGMASISVNPLPAVNTVTGGGAYCAGGTGVAIGMATTQTGVQYRLYQGTTAIGAPVTGIGSAISFGLQTAEGTYTVRATNTTTSCARAMTGAATVSVTPTVTPSVSLSLSTDNTVCAGTNVIFTAAPVNGGTAPGYEWHINGTAIAAATGSVYSYTPSAGDEISVMMTSSEACPAPATVSDMVTMTVNPLQTPVVTVTADHDGPICKGASVTFTAAPEYGGTAPIYSWMLNGAFAGAGSSYTLVPDNGDSVYCMMTSNFGCRSVNTVAGNTMTIEVVEPTIPTVVITTDAGSTVINPGQYVTFTATISNAGATPELQWMINNEIIVGATTTAFITNLLQDKDTVTCRILSSGPCGGQYSFNTIVIDLSSVSVATLPVNEMDVRIMPNPNRGTFSIKGTVGSIGNDEASLEITNMLGQVIYRNKVKTRNGVIDEQVSLDNMFSNGMYLLNISSGGASKVFYVTISR